MYDFEDTDGTVYTVKPSGSSYALFDENGYLTPGVYGYQPDLAENYINAGSLYLCCAVFLPLGLPHGHPFWAGEDQKWSSQRLWAGESVTADHAVD